MIALTPYLLILGSFTLIFFKVFRVKQIYSAIYTLFFLALATIFSAIVYVDATSSRLLYYFLGGFPPPIGITYAVDEFSSFIAFLTTLLALALFPLTLIFSESVDEYTMASYLGLLAGFTGILYTGDLFNMFVMLEVTLISTYSLMVLTGSRNSYKAVFNYMIVASVSSLFFFMGVVLIYFATSTVNIGHLGLILSGLSTSYRGYTANIATAMTIFVSMLMWSLVVDEALTPLHFWLPPAYSSINPAVASLLAGVSEGIAYYALLRIVYTVLNGLGPAIEYTLRVLGMTTIVVGGLGALYSNRFSYIASYTVVLDTGYIALALSLGPSAIQVALTYIVAHMIVKPILFLSSGWIKKMYADDSLENIQGALRSSPIMQMGLLIAALSVIGVPPTIMFLAKLGVYESLFALLSKDFTIPIALAVAFMGSALALAAFAKLIASTVLAPPQNEVKRSPPFTLRAYIAVFAVLAIVLGLFYSGILEPVTRYASDALVHGRDYYLQVIKGFLYGG